MELVRAVRNARADAKLEPAAWLPLDVYVEPELGTALEALRPAIERLARARRCVATSPARSCTGPRARRAAWR